MQLRSANNATLSASKVANRTHNPTIIAFDRNWNEIYRKNLNDISEMAYGVREDYETGYRGIKINQALSRSTHRIAYWATPNLPTNHN